MSHYVGRSIHTLGCKLGLFTKQSEYLKEVKRLGIANPPQFPEYPRMASTTYLENADKSQLAIVLIAADTLARDGITASGYLVHEAVHVWQFHLEIVGDEATHSKEFEAYGIQSIYENLAREYLRQTGGNRGH